MYSKKTEKLIFYHITGKPITDTGKMCQIQDLRMLTQSEENCQRKGS